MENKIINRCCKCNNKWIQRGKRPPKVCPKCKNPNWNRLSSKDMINLIVGNTIISKKL